MTCFTSSWHALLGVVVCGHKALEFVPVYYHAVEVRVRNEEQRRAFFFPLSRCQYLYVCTSKAWKESTSKALTYHAVVVRVSRVERWIQVLFGERYACQQSRALPVSRVYLAADMLYYLLTCVSRVERWIQVLFGERYACQQSRALPVSRVYLAADMLYYLLTCVSRVERWIQVLFGECCTCGRRII
jgi:hypothetical protein